MTVPTPAGDDAGREVGQPNPPSAARDAKLAWIVGGSLLVVYAALILTLDANPLPLPAGDVVLAAVWAAALLTLAFGVRRSGSIVARRPLGVTALAVSALLPMLSALLWTVLPWDASEPAAGVMIGQALAVIDLAALAVAAVEIARAGAVPHHLRWVPLIVLAVCAGTQLAVQIVGVAASDVVAHPGFGAVFRGATLLATLGILLLGILAIVFAPRDDSRRGGVVQVYPPAP